MRRGKAPPSASMSKDRRGTCAWRVTPHLPRCVTSFCAPQLVHSRSSRPSPPIFIKRETNGRSYCAPQRSPPGRARPAPAYSPGLRGAARRVCRRHQSAGGPNRRSGAAACFAIAANNSIQPRCAARPAVDHDSSIKRDLPKPGSPTISANWLSLLKIVETSRKPQFPRAVSIPSGRWLRSCSLSSPSSRSVFEAERHWSSSLSHCDIR
jgi:hypothetical protein